jgi:lipopolysaccharide transport system permease protein
MFLATPPPPHPLPETVISSRPSLRMAQTLRDLVAYRELFRAFVARDLKVRYKQTALGVIWVVLQPLLASGIFALVFRRLGAMSDTTAIDALVFFMAGLVPWNTFQMAVNSASASMETSANLVSKVYFPRLIVPGAYVVGSVVDFAIGAVVLVALGLWAGLPVWWLVLGVPVFLPIQLATAAGLGLFFAALNAQYRDIKYAVPFLLTIGMFVTVLVPLEKWGPWGSAVLGLNPMAAVVEGYRALLAGALPDVALTVRGALIGAGLLVGGLYFFRAREARLVDIL